jgi:hypothetical protein
MNQFAIRIMIDILLPLDNQGTPMVSPEYNESELRY